MMIEWLLLVSLQLFDWSKSHSKERLLTFYRLSDCIAERLKGLFVLFAGNLVKSFSDLLRQTNSCKTGETGSSMKYMFSLMCVCFTVIYVVFILIIIYFSLIYVLLYLV